MTRLPFELFLGFRYLKPKRTFVSVITLISVAGVVIGVWALIVVIAVMSGFHELLQEKLIGMQAHVTVTGGIIEDSARLSREILQTPQVKASAPFAMGLVLVEYNKRTAAPYLKGIDPQREIQVTRLADYVKQGSGVLDLQGEKILLGRALADQLGVYLGDKVTVYSPRNIEKKGEEVFLPLELTVTGIFNSGMQQFDYGLAFTSLETAQELYGLGPGIHGIEIKTADPFQATQEVANHLNARLPFQLRAQTWSQMNQQILGAIAVEKTMMFLILMLLVVLATFCITNTLITTTVQRTREIGVLRSVGASAAQITRLVVAQGFVVGLVGVALGLSLGYLTIANLQHIQDFLSRFLGINVFPAEIYNFTRIPAKMTWGDTLLITGSTMLVCTLGGLIPAIWAARLQPVEALRHD
jgi:lipoprotein-releasing system permease protein